MFYRQSKLYKKLKKFRILNYKKNTRALSKLMPKICCIDIGASYYEHTAWSVFLNSDNTLWLTCEPNSNNMLYKKTWNWSAKLETINSAIGTKKGSEDFYVTNIQSGSSLKKINICEDNKLRFDYDSIFPIKTLKIKTELLEDIIKERKINTPIIIKLDTQGSELDIIRTCETLIKNKKILAFEVESSLLKNPNYEKSTKFNELSIFLENYGYEIIDLKIHRNNFKKSNIPVECDAVFALTQSEVIKLNFDYQIALIGVYQSYKLYREINSFALKENLIFDFLKKNKLNF